MDIILHDIDGQFEVLSIEQSKIKNEVNRLIDCEHCDIKSFHNEKAKEFHNQYIAMIVDRSPRNKELNLVASYMSGSNIFGKVIFVRWISQYVGLTLNQVDELSEYLTNKRLLLQLADLTS